MAPAPHSLLQNIYVNSDGLKAAATKHHEPYQPLRTHTKCCLA